MDERGAVDFHNEKIKKTSRLLKKCRNLLFITGAGLSADSGLPTYRGIGGLYRDNDATPDGMTIEEALSGRMLASQPEIPWRHILNIEKACRGATFNRGHAVIAEMERNFPRVWVLTQNIDGFHQQAGSRQVIDIHGDIHRVRCTQCEFERILPDYSGLPPLPLCPQCGAVLRPGVVLFGEALPVDKLHQLRVELREGFDMVFTVGTGSVFPYISGPVIEARENGIPTVEINPGVSSVSAMVDIKLAAPAAETLSAIWKNYLGG